RGMYAAGDTAVGLLLQRTSSFDNELWARIDDWNTALLGENSEGRRLLDARFRPWVSIDKKLADNLRTVKDGGLELPKDRFWRFPSAVAQDYRYSTGGAFSSLRSVGKSVCRTVAPPSPDLAQRCFVLDGQHRISLLWDDLSTSDIRAILGSVAEEIEGTA